MRNAFAYKVPTVVVLLALLLCPAASPAADAGGNVVFILDASGSMWGQIEGLAKIQIAKEVMTDLIGDLPDGLNVGLVAYGHRRKGDCDDVEELVPLGPLNRGELVKQIEAITPLGKTPITLSVRKTAGMLKKIEEETAIILVSDGKETCEGDPCALVRELRAGGVKFVMHVIGFDVTEEEKAQLECIAQEGGGRYYTAGNAGEFKAAAESIVEEATSWGFLEVTALKNGEPFQAWIEVVETGGTGSIWNGRVESGGTKTFNLLPGTYNVKVIDDGAPEKPSVAFTRIEVRSGEMESRTADFSDGTLRVTTLMNGQPFNAEINLFRPTGEKFFTHWTTNGMREISLLPGTYDLTAVCHEVPPIKPTVKLPGIEIAPGETVERTAEFFTGFLKISASKNGQPFNTPVELYKPSGEKYYSHWTSNGVRTFKLLPGVYDVKVLDVQEKGQVRSFEGIKIEAGQTHSVEASF